jgi:hypothetical protein
LLPIVGVKGDDPAVWIRKLKGSIGRGGRDWLEGRILGFGRRLGLRDGLIGGVCLG